MSQPPSYQTQLRLTKYDPSLRDKGGGFMGDDWTAASDVGATFNGETLTLARYLEVESQHLQVVAAFLAEASVEEMRARGVERYDDTRCGQGGRATLDAGLG